MHMYAYVYIYIYIYIYVYICNIYKDKIIRTTSGDDKPRISHFVAPEVP